MNTTAQREKTLWTLSKRAKVAHLVILTAQLGWELKIDSPDILLTQTAKLDAKGTHVARLFILRSDE